MTTPAVDDGAMVELELPARPDVIAIARTIVVALARETMSFDEERNADIRLAVSEACTNAVEAHLDHGDAAPIRIRCWGRSDQLWVTVRDHGGGFDPDGLDWPMDPESPTRLDSEGGLGIPLIRLLADDVEFRRVDAGTEVVMAFGPEPVTGRITR